MFLDILCTHPWHPSEPQRGKFYHSQSQEDDHHCQERNYPMGSSFSHRWPVRSPGVSDGPPRTPATMQNGHSMGVSTWGRPDPTFSAFRRGGSQPVHGLHPRALTTTFGPTRGHNDDWGSEFRASRGGELNRSSRSGAPTGPNATFSVSGPTQPISGWVGTTLSIPLGRWFAIVAGPLPNDGFHDIQLWLDVYPQVIAVRREQQKFRFSVQLLFKPDRYVDELKTLVSSWATPHGVDIGTTTVEEPSGPSERFTGRKDLEYVDQVYAHARNLDELNALLQGAPPCIKGGAERARYGEFFLHYDTFPPLSGAAPPKAERLRHLDCVEFSTEWFLACLAGAHKYRSLGAGFAVPMWPTEGPVDAVIRRISRMARDDMGSILTPNPVADESFGFAKSSSVWRIKLDLGLDRPQYPKSE
ncbi:hypothetical protein BS47DRAFT_1367871 [Hydnum rufescens UP504]|uniref:Uncharacterized protein n=1 Tax=Hydnum rufescens UP504 TaxID=1448309 RepID=A0A9P6AH06_9AGAM|nr:hypothetical protein BS47DRAFT_1367871 [Hydnum rufescens UP504]